MPLMQFKAATKHNGKTYRMNERVSFPEPSAARLVAMHVAEVVRGQKVSADFASMIQIFRSAASKDRPPASKAIREKADAERREVIERHPRGPRFATAF